MLQDYTYVPARFWAIESPANGLLRRWLGEPDYTFDPWQFGHNYQKRTALWGNFNAPKAFVEAKPEGMKKFSMLHSKEIYPEFYGIYTRQERRAITPPGFARAFLKQTGEGRTKAVIIKTYDQLFDAEDKEANYD